MGKRIEERNEFIEEEFQRTGKAPGFEDLTDENKHKTEEYDIVFPKETDKPLSKEEAEKQIGEAIEKYHKYYGDPKKKFEMPGSGKHEAAEKKEHGESIDTRKQDENFEEYNITIPEETAVTINGEPIYLEKPIEVKITKETKKELRFQTIDEMENHKAGSVGTVERQDLEN